MLGRVARLLQEAQGQPAGQPLALGERGPVILPVRPGDPVGGGELAIVDQLADRGVLLAPPQLRADEVGRRPGQQRVGLGVLAAPAIEADLVVQHAGIDPCTLGQARHRGLGLLLQALEPDPGHRHRVTLGAG